MKVLENFLAFRNPNVALPNEACAFKDIETPSRLCFPMSSAEGSVCAPLVKIGDIVEPGQPLWEVDGKQLQPSPVKGKVIKLANVPDTRAHRILPAIYIEPSPDSNPKIFDPMDPAKEDVSALKKRIAAAGICTDHNTSFRLRNLFDPDATNRVKEFVVLGIDQEPGMQSFFQQTIDRKTDICEAVKLVGKIAGADTVYIALPQASVSEFESGCREAGVTILPIAPKYPATIRELIIDQHGLGKDIAFIGLESTLAALDAVKEGVVRHKTMFTVYGHGDNLIGNYRVDLGARLGDICDLLDIQPKEKDKVICGGLMRGFAQYSLEGAIDSGIHALRWIPQKSVIEWTNEPCVNCGKCMEICPVNLQVQLIGRYSEFNLFERTLDYEIEQCVGCGLCASVCTSRRPLLQLIHLAKEQVSDSETEVKEAEPIANKLPQVIDSETEAKITLPDNDPALSMFSGLPKLTVGFAPHWRGRASLTKLNIAFILALLPVIFASAVAQIFDPQAAIMPVATTGGGQAITAIFGVLGLTPAFLWFTGVFSTIILGLGLGLLIEYGCQVVMRQPYHATNGHGALMGLIIAMLMPPTVPVWVLFVAIFVAIFVGKQVFGGIGAYPMHPAMIGWLVVLLSWPQYVQPIGASSIASAHMAVIILTIIGGIALLILGFIRFEIPIGVIIGVAVFSWVFGGRLDGGVMDQLFTGHVFLAAFFLATDATSSPANRIAMWIHGLGIGFLIVLVRAFGVWPDAVPFAILLMNVVFPLTERIKPKVKKVAF